MSRDYFVYVMTNKSWTLYVGVTNDIARRVQEHKDKLVKGFTKKYKLSKLVYYELHSDVNDAIKREKEIKGWLRRKKLDLITGQNPNWKDLSLEL